MDFTKYVSLLETSSLYLTRADLLGDPFEGSSSKWNIKMRPVLYKDTPITDEVFEKFSAFAKWIRGWTYVNCWHMNEHESAAMWRLYAKSEEAIAIQSTYTKLASALPNGILLGAVQYLDYEKDWLPEGNTLYPFMHKRKSFEHEREVRAITQDLPSEADSITVGKTNPNGGRLVEIPTNDVVAEVYVAPTSPQWFEALVAGVTTRYGGAWSIHRSSLDEEPVY